MKRFFYGLIVSVVSIIWLNGCVQPQQVELIEREQRRLRGDTNQAQKSLDSLRSDIDSVRSSLADTRANLQQLQSEFSGLKERIEETRFQVGRQLGQSTRDGDQRVKDLEARVAKLGDALRAQEETFKARDAELKQLREALQQAQGAAAAAASAAASANEPLIADSSAGETPIVKKDYELAFQALEKRDYRLAITRFKEFLKKHPKSNLADNAQYWIGESHYGLREFDQAIIEFDAVRRRYPQGEKVPAALLKQGFAFAELGEKLNARLLLQEVVEKFPDTPEAGKARLRLKTFES
jgi:tol-pal system protein YbgF